MYAISRGQCSVLSPDTGYCFRRLMQGDFFGEFSVLSGGTRLATVRAATDCELFVLSAEAFSAVAEEFPSLRRRVEKERDKRKKELVLRNFLNWTSHGLLATSFARLFEWRAHSVRLRDQRHSRVDSFASLRRLSFPGSPGSDGYNSPTQSPRALFSPKGRNRFSPMSGGGQSPVFTPEVRPEIRASVILADPPTQWFSRRAVAPKRPAVVFAEPPKDAPAPDGPDPQRSRRASLASEILSPSPRARGRRTSTLAYDDDTLAF
eukprot:Hpha_TRINITY_DN15557_c3_g1::TRINITY_DN15557_c3_g1_i2::g.104675::m.104675